MSATKDPEKFAQYREKMRQIALERGYGKWMEGRNQPPEVVEKIRQKNKEIGNDPEERQRRSERAKANGTGKWMAGRTTSPRQKESARGRKGKTYEEIYGPEQAAEVRERNKVSNQKAKAG